MSDKNGSFKERTNDRRASVPLLVNWPSETSADGLSSDGMSCQATPFVVGVIGIPVPSTHESDAIQRTSKVLTPRLKMVLGGAPISFNFSEARKTSQSCVTSAESSAAATSLAEKRMRL